MRSLLSELHRRYPETLLESAQDFEWLFVWSGRIDVGKAQSWNQDTLEPRAKKLLRRMWIRDDAFQVVDFEVKG